MTRGELTIRICGNSTGLKADQLRRLDRLASRRNRSDSVVSPELARALTELSAEIQRQIGILIDRTGHLRLTVVGDARSVFLPDLSAYRQGRDRLCGLRLVHTHLHNAGLDDDDLTDLALLRLDAVAAIEVGEGGLPRRVHVAQLLPDNAADEPWRVEPPAPVHDLPQDFSASIAALEREFARNRTPRRAGDKRDRAILVHVSESPAAIAEESMNELRELARSAGIHVLQVFSQRRPVDPKYVMGKGKLKEAVIKAMQVGAEVILFDLNLSPAQVKNIADFTDLKVLDRTQVILDIFAQRAQTREGKIQVELAQLRYLLPRLSTKHTAMSRLTGGIGGRGPGETKLEIDRRRAQQRVTLLQREIGKLGNRRRLRRRQRTEKGVPTIAIVGYTNAGKSTLLNNLTRSNVTAANALFATLNPVSRRLRFPEERDVVLTDTVGFIRDLPPDLLDAFKTTFEEIQPADLLLHVLDASNPEIEHHYETVRKLLHELELDDKPVLVVLNKTDQCAPEETRAVVERFDGVPVSALDSATFPALMAAIEKRLWNAPVTLAHTG